MSISKSKIGKYALLRHKKHREKEGLFIVQGRKAIEDTSPFYEIEAIVDNPEDIRKVSTLENLPDIVAVLRIPEKTVSLNIGSDRFALALDGVQDPGNLGTIVRTAHWFGVGRVFCSRDCVDLYNPKVVQSTMGSIARVDVTYCSLEDLFEANPAIPVYGLLMEGENLFEAGKLPPGIIVMGSEGHGPSEQTLRHITRRLTIPPANPSDRPDSLNVAIATAITLSQLLK